MTEVSSLRPGGDTRCTGARPAGSLDAQVEEYWPDMEGLDYRDKVTDFNLPEGTFFDCAVVHLDHGHGGGGVTPSTPPSAVSKLKTVQRTHRVLNQPAPRAKETDHARPGESFAL
jgi:hypothetical protein